MLYQLHQQPSVADSPPQKRSYKQTKPSVETADSSDDSDNLRLQASFPPSPLSYPQIRNLEEGEKEWLVDINAAQALEARTRHQERSDEWLSMHKRVLTSSNFGKVFSCRIPTVSLMTSVFDTDLSGIPSIQHGKQFESGAVAAYLLRKRSDGSPVNVRSCGLVLHTQFKFLGASPDGMVYDTSSLQGQYGLLEVKCPYKPYLNKKTVLQACEEDSSFCCSAKDGLIQLKRTHHYFCQVQGQMAICAVKWCDFFVYVGEDHFLQRVVFDEVFWNEKLLPKLLHVYSTAAIPYLEGLGRETAVSVHVPQLADSMEQFENLLQGELCQSRIGGRNSSNACTIFCSVLCKSSCHTALLIV